MKLLMNSLAMSFGILAGNASAELMLNVDGEDYPLSALMENCQSLSDNPSAQITCFNAVSKLLEEQTGGAQESVSSVPDALDALRTVAQYENDDTGLSIVGTDCNIQLLYYNNYFHISRRNVSSIDLFSAEFDASQLQYDQIVEVRGAEAPLFSGQMDVDAIAATRGGVAIESSQHNFAPKSSRTTIGAYASEVAAQLSATEGQKFDFVLVHPEKHQDSAEIWSAFEDFVDACSG
jgi:hypothetical protein